MLSTMPQLIGKYFNGDNGECRYEENKQTQLIWYHEAQTHLVADCMNRWLGVDADGTAVYSLLKMPNSFAISALTGTCLGANILMALVCPPRQYELLSLWGEYG